MATERARPENFEETRPDFPAVPLRHARSVDHAEALAPRATDGEVIASCIAEARGDALFGPLWDCETDEAFRPYACAALSFAKIADRSTPGRFSFYREIATANRARLLDSLSEMDGWKTRLGLLPKTTYPSFSESDWRALFHAARTPRARRRLGQMKAISPVLARQFPLTPEPLRLPALLDVLNTLAVSRSHWDLLGAALADAPAELVPALIAKAKKVNSPGAFWDLFFECADRPWRPFDLPERFLRAPMLEPLRTTKDLEREGLQMMNCLAGQVGEVRTGRKAYFRWRGEPPADIQFVHANGWSLGKILGPRNAPLPAAEIERIRSCVEPLLGRGPDAAAAASDFADPTIGALCRLARLAFSEEERNHLAATLRSIRGESDGFEPDLKAYCIFGGDHGFIQFMADEDGREFLCEIQSHRYSDALEAKLTDDVVGRIVGSGFLWPRGKDNFLRWFVTTEDPDIERLAEFSCGVLLEIFGYEPGVAVTVKVHLP